MRDFGVDGGTLTAQPGASGFMTGDQPVPRPAAVGEMMPFSVRGRVCLVTGASSGLGAGFARLLVGHGAFVIGLSQRPPDVDPASSAGSVVHVRGDVRDASALDEAIAVAMERFGRLDVLVNNAGTFNVLKAARQSADDVASVFEVNVAAAADLCRRAHAVMRANPRGGSIINVTSVLARMPVKGLSAYGASKAALEQLTRAFALEWARDGVRVNALAPGWYPTAMTRDYLDRGLAGVLAGQIPMGRLGGDTDLAGPMLLLASDASRYMTGITLTVDGGYSVRG